MARKKRFQAKKKLEGFPIFSLPDKAFKELLNEMDSLTLLELSLLSKRCLKAIQDCSLEGSWLSFHPNCIRLRANDNLKLHFDAADSEDFKSEESTMRVQKERKNFRKINGVLLNNWSAKYLVEYPEWRVITVKFSLQQLENACTIFNYLNNLFKIRSLKYDLSSEQFNLFHNKIMKKLPRTVSQLTCESPDLKGEKTMWKIVKYLKIEESLTIGCPVKRLPKEIRDIENIWIHCAEKIPTSDFLQLNCKELYLQSHSLTNDDIRALIQKWLNNESQLEMLKVKYKDSKNDLNAFVILEGFTTKKWDRKKRSRDYYCINCAEFLDIERESDGALASLGYDQERGDLVFVSWKNRPNEPTEVQTFPLYSLPHLALKIVMEKMDTVEVVEISLLSKRSKAYVRSCSIKIKALIFSMFYIKIGPFETPYTNMTLVFDPSKSKTTSFRTIDNCRFNEWTKRDRYQVNIYHCTPTHPDGKFKAFQHLHDLFRYEHIKYFCDTEYNKFINEAMRKLPRDVTDLEIYGSEDDEIPIEDQVGTILDYYGAVNGLKLGSTVTSFSERVRNMDFLIITFAEKLPFETLLTLNCKLIRVWNHKLTNKNVITWIQKWQNEDSRLEDLYIKTQELKLNFKTIKKGLNWTLRSRKNSDGRNQEYIVLKRNNDGLRASVEVDHRVLSFNVWTEKFMKDNFKYGYDFRQDL